MRSNVLWFDFYDFPKSQNFSALREPDTLIWQVGIAKPLKSVWLGPGPLATMWQQRRNNHVSCLWHSASSFVTDWLFLYLCTLLSLHWSVRAWGTHWALPLAPAETLACPSPGPDPARWHRNPDKDEIIVFLYYFSKLLFSYPWLGSIFSQLGMNKFKRCSQIHGFQERGH